MIVVDTSVWISALRNRQAQEALHLAELLDQDVVAIAVPTRIEILAGARATEQPRLSRLLSALPTLHPSDVTWQRIEQWLGGIKRAGDWFGVADLLIAGIAAENSAPVWSLDSDFTRMAKLRLIDLHHP